MKEFISPPRRKEHRLYCYSHDYRLLLQPGEGFIRFKECYLIETEEAQVTDHTQCTDSRSSGDLTCNLQADLHNLQRVGKDHLRGSSLNTQGKKATDDFSTLAILNLLLHLTWFPSLSCIQVFFSHEKVSKVTITSWSINYFAISSDGKECWANVCKDEQRYQKQKQKKNMLHWTFGSLWEQISSASTVSNANRTRQAT